MIGDNYELFKKEFLQLAGIDLSSYKESQMKRRIDNFISKNKVAGYHEFIGVIKKDSEMYDRFITYLTINVSEFYRNPLQWETLQKVVIPHLLQHFNRPLKIWSAACSTGDEPYSLAMVLSDFLPLNQIQILATDMDNEVLAKARKGCYTENSIKGLPKRYRDKFLKTDGDGIVSVSKQLKACINFKQHNLLKDGYPQGVHMIVCRNVMIYFTEEAKDKIYQRFSSSLQEHGILFVGSTEQIIGATQYNFYGMQSFFYERLCSGKA